jgi:hypothetical protein
MAYEALHTMHSRLKGNKGYMAIKLDMSKAYDWVEWNYLEEIMRRTGFANQWIHLIMQCVSSVSYRVLLMANLMVKSFLPTAYGRETPLSPYP